MVIKDTRIRTAIFILLVTGALFGVLFAVLSGGKVRPAKVDRPESGSFIVLNEEVVIPVSIADTEPARARDSRGHPCFPRVLASFLYLRVLDDMGFG